MLMRAAQATVELIIIYVCGLIGMAIVVEPDEHFTAEVMGKALSKLYDIDGPTLSLQPHLNEEGCPLTCPITMEPILQNAALIQDGCVYQLGYIRRWLDQGDTYRSPLTNCVLPHRNILRMSPLTDVMRTFLGECFNRRAQVWKRQISKARCTDRGSCEELEQALVEIESYVSATRY